jgi:periplasmic protein TonB
MFEDSLVESTGRIRTRSRWLAVASFLLQAAILAVLILIPYLYPAALPKQAFNALLLAPPPPPSRPNLPERAASVRTVPMMLTSLTLPSHIQAHASMVASAEPAPPGGDIGFAGSTSPGGPPELLSMGSGPVPHVVAAPKPKPGPVRVSAGVTAGLLLEPIRASYPAIALAARVQGTVVVEAVISKSGAVENAHAVSGPPMLAQAAVSAVARARYQPYRLSGEPVEVETTVNVVFQLQQ